MSNRGVAYDCCFNVPCMVCKIHENQDFQVPHKEKSTHENFVSA